MEKYISKIKQRIIQYADYQGLSKRKIYQQTGIANGVLDKSTGLSEFNIEKFISTFSDVDVEWLLTGRGQMLIEENKNITPENLNPMVIGEATQVYKTKTDRIIDEQIIPLYDIYAAAGIIQLFRDSNSATPVDTIKLPNVGKTDGSIYVSGDSMYPAIKSGDIVAYKIVNDLRNGIFEGNIFIVNFTLDGEDIVAIKYIQKSDKGEEYIKLVSHNTHYAPKDIHRDSIRSAAIVKAQVRINRMV